MNNYQKNVFLLKQKAENIIEEIKSLENTKEKTIDGIERLEKEISFLKDQINHLISKLEFYNKGIKSIIIEDTKIFLAIECIGEVFLTIEHFFTIPFLIKNIISTPDELTNAIESFLSIYFQNATELFKLLLTVFPTILLTEFVVHKELAPLVKSFIKSGSNIEDLENVELNVYNYQEQLKGATEALDIAKKNLLSIDEIIKEKSLENLELEKEQKELIEEENEIYNQLSREYLKLLLEEDINKAYDENKSKKIFQKRLD